jgi:catalase
MTPVRHHFAAVAETASDPSTIPRLSGIEPSDDPSRELRAAVYLISGRRRRAA